MLKLTFKLTFASRADSTPTHSGWTYHHVLPWRYYYLMGYIIANVAKMKYLSNNYKINDENFSKIINNEQKNLKIDKIVGKSGKAGEIGKALEPLFGSEVEGFNRNLNESGSALVKLLLCVGIIIHQTKVDGLLVLIGPFR